MIMISLFIIIIRNLGTPTNRLDRRKWQSLINFIWNVILFIVVLYSIYKRQNLKFLNYNTSDLENAFLRLIYRNYDYAYEFTYIVQAIYLFYYGPKLIHLMQEKIVTEVYDSQSFKNIFIIAITVITLNHITFVLFYWHLMIKCWNNAYYLQIIGYFIIHTNIYLYILVFHYVKQATHVQLLRIVNNFRYLTSFNNDIDYIISSIRSLAMINHQMNGLFSWSFLMFSVCTALDLIVTSANFLKKPEALLTNCSFFLSIITYLLYYFWLDSRIIKLTKLMRQTISQMSFTRRLWGHQSQKNRIRLIEMEIYFEYLQTSALDICPLNLEFFLDLFCFVMNYTLLICQTL